MKLCNKKTGESGELHYYPDKAYHFAVSAKDPTHTGIYKTLGELLQDWTDFIVHVPTEPLIKDEKIRKAVRAWAGVNKYERLFYWCKDGEGCFSFFDRESENEILFDNLDGLKGLIDDKTYTITELCGEEEE